MPEILDEIMAEIAILMGEISIVRWQLRRGQKTTEAMLARLKRHAARIVSMLQAVEVEH
jgi:hypothetical protein